jgi:hypothetical protein
MKIILCYLKQPCSFFLFFLSSLCVIYLCSLNYRLINLCRCFTFATGGSRIYVSVREYYCYKLQMRPQQFNILLYGGRLFQQFLVNMWVKVESMRLDWYSLPKHQKIIQAELYMGIVDKLKAGEARTAKVGRRVVLPRNFDGSERAVKAHFLDAMTLVQRFGKPDYFVI